MTRVIPPSKVFSVTEAKKRLKERKLGASTSPPQRPKIRPPRKTVVTSVCILPELVIRVKRDLGHGNFSAGVVKACMRALAELDREKKVLQGD
jgi:hypothetical protein